MAAHLTDRLWDIGDIVKLIEEWGVTDGRRGEKGKLLLWRCYIRD
jgi:hypothetical protein